MTARVDGAVTRPSRFRADIQGLRAIAVLVVIADHAGIGPLHGGFVGVDVFFVISGFLISSLLFGEVARSGTLSITGFYARRARRILPAATLVTLVTLATSVALLSLIEARQVARDSLWVTFFAGNVHFASLGTDYFSKDEPPSPLQHYWSLSVEEQFYVVWPLLLLVSVWLVSRLVPDVRRVRLLRRGVLLPLLVVGCALSLGYSIAHTASAPTSAYFSTATRAWELAIGALVALVAPWFATRFGAGLRTALLAGGFAAVSAACLLYSPETPFPGSAALLPVLGAAALLLAGTSTSPTLSHRLLGVRPLRVVGDWSYSLYLWHWPVLIIATRLTGPLTTTQTAMALALVFALSAASYTWVETPFRTGRRLTPRRSLLLYPVSVALVAGGFAASHGVTAWELERGGDRPAISLGDFGVAHESRIELDRDPALALVQASVIAARHDMAIPSELTPNPLTLRGDNPDVSDCDYYAGSTDLCPRGDQTAGRSIVVVGDSHGRMWIPAIEQIGTEQGWTVYFLVKPHCTAAYVSIDHAGDRKPWPECTDFHDWTREQIAALDPDLVVVASSMFNKTLFVGDEKVTGDDRIAELTGGGFEDLFRVLRPLTDRLVLIRDVPMGPRDPSTCLTTEGNDLGDCLFRPAARSTAIANESVAAAERVGVDVVDPTPWICWGGACPLVIGSTVTYRDIDHLSSTFVATLTDRLAAALGLEGSSAVANP